MEFLSVELLVAFLNLTLLEIILGIDNVLFISIISERLPLEMQEKARKIGLLGALVSRILLLLSIKWLTGLTGTLFTALGHSFSIRDLILLCGGLFLLAKATIEIYSYVEMDGHHEMVEKGANQKLSFKQFIFQIILIDLVFSIDSVITAVGLVSNIPVMICAIIVSVLVMIVFSEPLNRFIKSHAALRILALSFLIVVGVVLVADGMGEHVPRGYIYFGMGFTLFVELLNIRRFKKIQKKKAA